MNLYQVSLPGEIILATAPNKHELFHLLMENDSKFFHKGNRLYADVTLLSEGLCECHIRKLTKKDIKIFSKIKYLK